MIHAAFRVCSTGKPAVIEVMTPPIMHFTHTVRMYGCACVWVCACVHACGAPYSQYYGALEKTPIPTVDCSYRTYSQACQVTHSNWVAMFGPDLCTQQFSVPDKPMTNMAA